MEINYLINNKLKTQIKHGTDATLYPQWTGTVKNKPKAQYTIK